MAEAPPPPALPLPGGGWFALRDGLAEPVAATARPPACAVPPHQAPGGAATGAPPAPRRRASGLDTLHLSLRGVALAVPASLAEHIHPMPDLQPLPGAPPGVAGLALAGGLPILVLDTVFVGGGSDDGGGPDAAGLPALLLALRWQGRRIGLPAARIAAGPAVAALRMFHAWLGSGQALAALAHAPPARDPAAAAVLPERHLVIFRAGGLRACLPIEAVRAVLPPGWPQPLPQAGAPDGAWRPAATGFAAHRGDVLPVRDAGRRLGGPPCWTEAGAPMIRLARLPEHLLAVTAIEGVRRIPAADITPLGAGEGLVAGLARVQGESLLLLSAAVLAA